MNATAPARPAELHERRVQLERRPAAARQARGHVRAALWAWRVPVDPDVAVLLASDVVTDAITRGAGPSVTVTIRCSRGQLRVDVCDAQRPLALVAGPPEEGSAAAADEEGSAAAAGLALVELLADEWGVVRTPTGRAVYFTLAFRGQAGG